MVEGKIFGGTTSCSSSFCAPRGCYAQGGNLLWNEDKSAECTDTWICLCKASAPAASDIVMVDAGSSGSKVFVFTPGKATGKWNTRCNAHNFDVNEKTNQGIAALAYEKAECEWQVGSASPPATPLNAPEEFAEGLLGELARVYATASGNPGVDQVGNKNDVPILATAGMRLLSTEDNDKVWGYICQESHHGLTFAERGEKCNTLPGTTEAYYEFLANAAAGNANRVMTGTFTIGGASAQIAIPLQTADDVRDFEAMKNCISETLDCTKLTVSDGHTAPFFNTVGAGGPEKECIDDYITYKPKADIQGTPDVLRNIGDVEGVGLISFLGLHGRGSFIAGGVNEIQNWAKEVGCDQPTLGCPNTVPGFSECAAMLQEKLAQDVMFKHVTDFFRTHFLDIDSFSYNTKNAISSFAGMSVDNGKMQAWDLYEELKSECMPDNSVNFGWENGNTCMKALYTSLYTTAFFSNHSVNLPLAAKKYHDNDEVISDPDRDWSEGKADQLKSITLLEGKPKRKSQEAEVPSHCHGDSTDAKGHRSLLAQKVSTQSESKIGARARALLDVPLRHHTTTYMEGAKLVFGARES